MRLRYLGRKVMLCFVIFAMIGSSFSSWVNLEGSHVQAAGGFAGGSGSSDDPFLISTGDQLSEVRVHPNSYFELINDIDLSEYKVGNSWEPIGTSMEPFRGSLNGNNYIISNLYVDSSLSSSYRGLFGYMVDSGSVKNLTLENAYVEGGNEVGTLVGYVSDGLFENITVTGSVYGLGNNIGGVIGVSVNTVLTNVNAKLHVKGYEKLGGVVGSSENNTVSNVYYEGDIEGVHYWIGGLFGQFIDGTIRNSGSKGTVSGHQYIGGLVGALEQSIVSESYSHADVTNTDDDMGGLIGNSMNSHIEYSYATGSVTGEDDLGGLVGYSEETTIEYSYATGNVTGGDDVGGLVGDNEGGIISYSYATGNVDANGEYVGGLVGENKSPATADSLIEYSYATGHVSGDSEVGGLVGYNDKGIVNNSYATGSITGSNVLGGLVGDNNNGLVEHSYSIGLVTLTGYGYGDGGLVGSNVAGSIVSSYYDTQTSGKSDSLGEGLATQAMKEIGSYLNWDFTSIWKMDAHNDGYPYFKVWKVADLSDLTLSAGAVLSPVFEINNVNYQSNVAHSVNSIQVTPTVVEPGSNVTVAINNEAAESVDSGQASAELALDVGENTIEVVVTALDGTTSKSYKVAVTRKNKTTVVTPSLSSNANLKQLSLTGDAQLASDFSSDTLNYTMNVDSSLQHIGVILTLADDYATAELIMNGTTYAVKSGSVSNELELKIGENIMEIIITAENGTHKRYTLTIVRNQEIEATYQCLFNDIENHWAKAEICEAASLGITEGKDTYTFAPNIAITRTEFVVMLLHTLQIEHVAESIDMSFHDQGSIPNWARPAIYTAIKQGIIEGYPDGTLRPLDTISRIEMAAIIARVMDWQNSSNQSSPFSDDISIPNWAKENVQVVRDQGILTGRTDNKFVPFGITTRAEAAVTLLRLWNLQ